MGVIPANMQLSDFKFLPCMVACERRPVFLRKLRFSFVVTINGPIGENRCQTNGENNLEHSYSA
jgi:hypothetical protein